MNVFILFFCNILELLMSRVSGNDKVYELARALILNQSTSEGEYNDRPVRLRTAHLRSSTNQGTPRPRRSAVRRGRVKYSVGITYSVWAPNASDKDSFLALRRVRE
jgi:hypothetical protein